MDSTYFLCSFSDEKMARWQAIYQGTTGVPFIPFLYNALEASNCALSVYPDMWLHCKMHLRNKGCDIMYKNYIPNTYEYALTVKCADQACFTVCRYTYVYIHVYIYTAVQHTHSYIGNAYAYLYMCAVLYVVQQLLQH